MSLETATRRAALCGSASCLWFVSGVERELAGREATVVARDCNDQGKRRRPGKLLLVGGIVNGGTAGVPIDS